MGIRKSIPEAKRPNQQQNRCFWPFFVLAVWLTVQIISEMEGGDKCRDAVGSVSLMEVPRNTYFEEGLFDEYRQHACNEWEI